MWVPSNRRGERAKNWKRQIGVLTCCQMSIAIEIINWLHYSLDVFLLLISLLRLSKTTKFSSLSHIFVFFLPWSLLVRVHLNVFVGAVNGPLFYYMPAPSLSFHSSTTIIQNLITSLSPYFWHFSLPLFFFPSTSSSNLASLLPYLYLCYSYLHVMHVFLLLRDHLLHAFACFL